MDLPLVSVILPTHNRLPFLREAMATVLAQDYPHLELIIIDDGSTDGTQAAMHKMRHHQVHYRHVRNRGPAGARNLGLQLARGELIAFADSDDLWEVTKIGEQVRRFQQQAALGMLATNFRYIDHERRPVSDPAKAFGYQLDDLIGDILASTFPMATSTMMIRRAVFERVGAFNEQLRTAEDLDLWLRIGLAYPVAYLDRVLASIRLHDNHLMRETPRHQVWIDSADVINAHREALLERHPDLDQHLGRLLAQAGNIALLSGRRRAALAAYAKALHFAPRAWQSYKNMARCALPLAYLRQRYERHVDHSIHPLMQMYR
jgi:glycosyltransferase involved in cell wall biosynthesis